MAVAETLLTQRLRDVAGTGLRDLLRDAPHLAAVSPALAALLHAASSPLRRELAAPEHRADLAETMARGFCRFLGHEYQYLDLGTRTEAGIYGIYLRGMDDMAMALDVPDTRTAASRALRRHHARLREVSLDLLADAGARDAYLTRWDAPRCAGYAPHTQIAILDLDVPNLPNPVIDIGCGRDGALVRHLRDAGHAAIGIDRDAADADFLIRGDWFALPVPPQGWGSVIAHLSFSLHFMHAHYASEDNAARYAEGYMTILRSLRPGGRFVYAPSLPFIEDLLPAHSYEVSRRRVKLAPGPHAWPGAQAIKPAATTVRRRP